MRRTIMPTLCLDFDGVIHLNRHPWRGPAVILDTPVPGAKAGIDQLRARHRVKVFSGRCRVQEGVAAIQAWLDTHGIVVDEVCSVKPLAVVYLDDRGVQFNGDWSAALDGIRSFRHWQGSNRF